MATGMPVRVMRNVKSHGVAVTNMRRVCQQLADMNHVGRRFLPWIQNIVQGERQAVVLLLEELMRCAYGLAPGRKLTAAGNYARTASSKMREVPFLDPLGNSKLANVVLHAAEHAPASLQVALQVARAADTDLHRRRQFERHQVWRQSIASAVLHLPCPSDLPSAASGDHDAGGCFKHMEDLDAHVQQVRHAPIAKRSAPPAKRKTRPGSAGRAPCASARPALQAARAFVDKVASGAGTQAAAAPAPCLRCANWDGRQVRKTVSPFVGAGWEATLSRPPGRKSPFKIANSPPKSAKASSGGSLDSDANVGRLREWMRSLKGGTVQWPHNMMDCAPGEFARAWTDGVALCLLAGALQPLAGRTLLEGWEQHPRTHAHRAHNVRRALSVLGLQAKMHVVAVPVRLKATSSALPAATGNLRGPQALACDEAILNGDEEMVIALLRLVRLAYRPP